MTDLVLILLILVIPIIAQLFVTSAYNSQLKVSNKRQLSGQEIARKILDTNGLDNIYIVETKGTLSDHYDSSRKVVRLSPDVFHGNSISAMAIAAHECGHAIQDKEGYLMLRIRSAIYPVVNIATSLSYYIIFIGFLLNALNLIMLGIACTACGLLFQLVTLPVEFDASRKGKNILKELNYVETNESTGVSKVLSAAAMTYVAGVLASALQVLRLLLIFNRRD